MDRKYTYQLSWQDAIEWCVSAVKLIGAPMALQPKQSCVTIDNYRGILPCDVETIHQVAGSLGGCIPFPMTSKTNTFHPVFSCTTQINSSLLGEAGIINDVIEAPIGEDISGNPVYDTDAGVYIFPETTTDTNSGGTILTNNPTYYLNDSFIFTSFEEGFVFLAYDAFPIDKEGLPLIPDNRRYIEGVKAYVGWKIDYILWRAGEIDKATFDYSEKEYLWYIGSAGNASRMPNRDGMESLLNSIKLIPQKHSHDNFYRHLNS